MLTGAAENTDVGKIRAATLNVKYFYMFHLAQTLRRNVAISGKTTKTEVWTALILMMMMMKRGDLLDSSYQKPCKLSAAVCVFISAAAQTCVS